jgi:cell division protein ZipA
MREALIVIGILVFLGIGLDCLRRMRNARRDSLQMQINMSQGIKGDALDDERLSELPSGGARVAKRKDPSISSPAENSEPYPAREPTVKNMKALTPEDVEQSRAEPAEQPSLNLDEPVPMLMDADAEEDSEPTFTAAKDSARDPLMGGESAVLSKPRVVQRQSRADGDEEEVTEVIVINVMSRDREGFHGAALLESLLASGMRFGAMNIFHHYEDDQGEGAILYSMANIVKPGTFDLNSMESFQTPGVSFFLQLPMEKDGLSAIDAFESMLATAQALVNNLNGELKDEHRSVMTAQTVEHCRQRIRDFALLKLTKSGKFTAEK